MATTTIRQAGPYTIATDGEHILVNGAAATLSVATGSRDGSKLLFWVEGKIGANGKRDMIGITAAEYAIHTAARPVAAIQQDDTAKAERVAAERAWDMANNEGGEGYNPHRLGSERSYARSRNVDRRYPEGA